MTTPQDLLIVTLNIPSSHDLGQGDLSLALAGAEVLDLVAAGALTLEGDRLVPGAERATGDRLLDEAEAALVRQQPYETIEEWLWRRGRGLAEAYVAALEAETPTADAGRRHWLRRRSEPAPAAIDSPSRHHANERWADQEPVLVGLANSLGIGERSGNGANDTGATDDAASDDVTTDPAGTVEADELATDTAFTGGGDGPVVTVLAALGDALTELEAVRQRRRIEEDAFDNVWRAP
ncbi:GPP34 family phosphoprotein [Streptomyces sp. NPDC059861]|uniref:GOLPH3/VPS74 family protein n=1 Tax=Streptomyces sp. NPDC059861 TaxID=3346974 RepID=UPI003661919A